MGPGISPEMHPDRHPVCQKRAVTPDTVTQEWQESRARKRFCAIRTEARGRAIDGRSAEEGLPCVFRNCAFGIASVQSRRDRLLLAAALFESHCQDGVHLVDGSCPGGRQGAPCSYRANASRIASGTLSPFSITARRKRFCSWAASSHRPSSARASATTEP